MVRTNFANCAAIFVGNNSIGDPRFAHYVYNGTVRGMANNRTSQITYDGCRNLCGTSPEYYPWGQVASTITTWTLPVVGVILQAPFESNRFWATIFVLARWIGNPIASLSYTLWNMKVTGKCALLMDMAVASDTPRESLDPRTSDFAQMRDSLYILAAMNQFSVNSELSRVKSEAETLLRIALFSKGLHRLGTDQRFLPERRQFVAERLRTFRKHGVVPVYISTMWFFFALCISIQGSFNLLGVNSVAHDLALGFLLGWLPTLFLSFIVDRNFTSVSDVRMHLNELVQEVLHTLSDQTTREKYIQTYQGRLADAYQGRRPLDKQMRQRIDRILAMPQATNEFFVKFAGQGRLRWHYGVAHPILTDIERNFIRDRGRAWLSIDEQEARSNLVLGDTDERGLVWFDLREIWQVLSSCVIVLGTITGAFVLSFFVPTVGLGCRSGGYMIFALIAILLVVLEMAFWTLISNTEDNPLANTYHMDKVLAGLANFINRIDHAFVSFFTFVSNRDDTAAERNWSRRRTMRRERTIRDWSNICIFRPIEILNFTWLSYIVMAQTVGSYRTCECQCSTWGGANYMDFNNYSVANLSWLHTTWTTATAITCTIMALSILYIVVEWCLQSHLSTENYDAALRGLRRTRTFRRITYPYRRLFDVAIRLVTTTRRSVVWTYDVTYQAPKEMEDGSFRTRRRRFDSVPQIRVDPAVLRRMASGDSVAVTDVDGTGTARGYLHPKFERTESEGSLLSRTSSAGGSSSSVGGPTSVTGLLGK